MQENVKGQIFLEKKVENSVRLRNHHKIAKIDGAFFLPK